MRKIMTGLLAISAITLTTSSYAADYSTGIGLGSTGLGANFSLKNDFKLREEDQIQTRIQISGLKTDDAEELDFSGIDYDGKIDSKSARATMDWFPFNNRFFLSAGIDYSNCDLSVKADSSKPYHIGEQSVGVGDNVTTKLDIDDKGISPYIGIGWGNRIGEDSGFSFLAELGVLVPTGDPDVSLTVIDPGNKVSAANINAEKKQIENDVDGATAVASVAVMYHF